MDRRELIAEQSNFYTIAYRKLLSFSYFMLFLIFIALALIIFQYLTQKPPTYFITTVDGRLIEIFPTTTP